MIAVRKRHQADVKKACDTYESTRLEKQALDDKKADTKRKLDEYSSQVICRYQDRINKFLDELDAGFRLANTRHVYPGGVASCEYQVVINDTNVTLGDPSTPMDRPSFRNTLSSGDRSTLALAFFLAQLCEDPNRAATIVVFDDPFNSQDSFRKSWTVEKIKACGMECEQVILLSHDHRFIDLLWKQLAHTRSERKSLKLKRVGQMNTTIVPWDIEEAMRSPGYDDHQALVDYHLGGIGHPRDVVRKIRPVLESHIRSILPGEVTENDNLGDIISIIRQAGQGHQLFPVVRDLDAINAFTTPYAHGQSAVVAADLDEAELGGFIKRALRIVGSC